MKRAFLVLCTFVLVLGIGCLNYTSADQAAEHRTWAEANGLPAPSQNLFFAGLACTVAGAGVAGFALGRPKKKK